MNLRELDCIDIDIDMLSDGWNVKQCSLRFLDGCNDDRLHEEEKPKLVNWMRKTCWESLQDWGQDAANGLFFDQESCRPITTCLMPLQFVLPPLLWSDSKLMCSECVEVAYTDSEVAASEDELPVTLRLTGLSLLRTARSTKSHRQCKARKGAKQLPTMPIIGEL